MRTLRIVTSHYAAFFILWFLIVVFVAYFSFVAMARHDNFHSLRLDLGNMEQTVWNLTHGNGFMMTDPMGDTQVSRLAAHADFLLILVAPLYLLWSDARMLVLVQSIVIGLGALPVYWIAKDKLKSPCVALLFALAYLLYPPLQRMALHDFHAVALSMTFWLFAYWYMSSERYGWFLVFAILAALGKETEWMTLGLMGVYIALRNKRYVFGSTLTLAGFAMFYFLYWHVIPQASSGGQHFAISYLSEFGDNQSSVVVGMLRNPLVVIRTMVQPDRLDYFYRLLFPIGFLPLFAPFPLVFAVHTILINTLSSNGLMRQIDYQYTSNIIPFLFVAAIAGYEVVRRFIASYKDLDKAKSVRVISLALLGCILAGSYLWGELPLTREDRFFYFLWAIPEKNIMQRVTYEIGSDASVSVTNNIGAHHAKRETLYNFPINALHTDYSVALLGDRYAWPSGKAQKDAVEQLLVSPEYELIAQQGDYYAFRKRL